MHTPDNDKPTDTIPPITNTGEEPQQDAAAAEPTPEPNWWEREGIDERTALPVAQSEYITRFLDLDGKARDALNALREHVGDARLGHLFPVPQRLIDSYNAEGPLATDDPALRRHAALFGMTARIYALISTAYDIVFAAGEQFTNAANALAAEAKRARGDAPADPLASLRSMIEKMGGSLVVAPDGATVDEEAKIIAEALAGAKPTENAA
jgi:hypothetical protein